MFCFMSCHVLCHVMSYVVSYVISFSMSCNIGFNLMSGVISCHKWYIMLCYLRLICLHEFFAMCTIIYISQNKSEFFQTWNSMSFWGTKHKIIFTLWFCEHMYAHKWAMCTLLFAMCTMIQLSQIQSDFHQTLNFRSFWGTKHKILFTLWFQIK